MGDLANSALHSFELGVVTKIIYDDAHILFGDGITRKVDIREFKKAPSGTVFKCENLGIEITQR